ncbi:MAG: hypothetical protein QG567_624 [Campylobacterota bacterium]|nr:hypothetical protein [Campylobacterota bacterium]
MALKDDIEYIKNDLVGESRFLEEYIKLENRFKKHKKKIFIAIGIIVVLFFGNVIFNMIKENRLYGANEAYVEYLNNPTKTNNLEIIKEKNQALYDLIMLKDAVKNSDQATLTKFSTHEDPIVSQLANYHLAVIANDASKMQEYSMKEGAILKDFVSLQLAYKLYAEGKIKEAKSILATIPFDSQLKKSAMQLEHYGLSE